MIIHFVGDFKKKEKETIIKQITSLEKLYQTPEFAIVKNPSNIYPPYDIYPLKPKNKIDSNFSVVLTDMDGTTTSTETLCLHSLEFMMKKITKANFSFQQDDYPHIIGNSTTKHVEYLLNKYQKLVNLKSLKDNSKKACNWTLSYSKDKKRKKEAEESLKIAKLSDLSKDFSLKVKLAIEIYYARYHSILEEIKKGEGEKLAKKLTKSKPLISPMPGIPLFLSLIKGVLQSPPKNLLYEEQKKIKKLIQFFNKREIKIGLVTSSIFYEADIVLTEVFRKIREKIREWDIDEIEKNSLLKTFSSYKAFYNTVVTADDSHEIRLKPHRDLYSIALFNLNVSKEKLSEIIGFEDSTSGIIALRATGVGKVVAVPFKESSTHDFFAATLVCKGGVKDFLFNHLLNLV
ncbi:MAG: hypothetical protein KatS3mg090_0443 [Patescibacteria group bacterium]|nr:MAG: hypothetical protein KatS3mg090_0443 [Patescibacteria group bacterium]